VCVYVNRGGTTPNRRSGVGKDLTLKTEAKGLNLKAKAKNWLDFMVKEVGLAQHNWAPMLSLTSV